MIDAAGQAAVGAEQGNTMQTSPWRPGACLASGFPSDNG